jgi:hypothetical protein
VVLLQLLLLLLLAVRAAAATLSAQLLLLLDIQYLRLLPTAFNAQLATLVLARQQLRHSLFTGSC